MKVLLFVMMFTSLSTFGAVQIDRNCVGDGHIPGKSKDGDFPLRASFEFDGSHIYVQVFGDDFDTMSVDYSIENVGIANKVTERKVIGKIMEPELLKMESEGSFDMKNLETIKITFPLDKKINSASLSFSKDEKQQIQGAIFKNMECEELD